MIRQRFCSHKEKNSHDLTHADVFFSLQPGDKTRIVLRPLTSTKQDDYLDNIRTLGLILEQILGIKQT